MTCSASPDLLPPSNQTSLSAPSSQASFCVDDNTIPTSARICEPERSSRVSAEPMKQYRGRQSYGPKDYDEVRIYKWAKLRRKMQEKKYWDEFNANRNESFSYYETDYEAVVENTGEQRESLTKVLRSAFLLIFLMQTLGCWLSLTFSSLMAFLDMKLDAGYKIGYLIAWILGGRGGILLTLCLAFASWVCGKTSSSVVVLVVVAMWVGSNLAKYAPLPQGALLTLLYMSIKLQVDLT